MPDTHTIAIIGAGAAGLAAAIPALIGFNYFANAIRQKRAQMEDFLLEFINLAERNFT